MKKQVLKQQTEETFINKPEPLHDLLQKAVGWMLRHAIEKFPPEERRVILKTV